MVQHRHADRPGERGVGELHVGRIAFDDGEVRARQAFLEGFGERAIDLDRSQVGHVTAKPLGGAARARADLERVVAEVNVLQNPGQHVFLDSESPAV